jgi:hypothetical protein
MARAKSKKWTQFNVVVRAMRAAGFSQHTTREHGAS